MIGECAAQIVSVQRARAQHPSHLFDPPVTIAINRRAALHFTGTWVLVHNTQEAIANVQSS